MTEKKPKTAPSPEEGAADPFKLLKADHRAVKEMHEEYESLVEEGADPDQRRELANRLCDALTVHVTLEEEILYPALREALKDDAMLDEAEVEHASAKDLIAQIQSMTPDQPKYDARVIVLCEYVQHHVEEEEGEMFKKARRVKSLDRADLATRMLERRQQLEAGLPGNTAG